MLHIVLSLLILLIHLLLFFLLILLLIIVLLLLLLLKEVLLELTPELFQEHVKRLVEPFGAPWWKLSCPIATLILV